MEMTNFQYVQARAYSNNGTSEFIGFGTIDVVIARGRKGRLTYLQYRLKGRRLSEVDAERLIENHMRMTEHRELRGVNSDQ